MKNLVTKKDAISKAQSLSDKFGVSYVVVKYKNHEDAIIYEVQTRSKYTRLPKLLKSTLVKTLYPSKIIIDHQN